MLILHITLKEELSKKLSEKLFLSRTTHLLSSVMYKDKGRGIGLAWSLHPFSDRLERTYGTWDFELGRCCVEMHYGIFLGTP